MGEWVAGGGEPALDDMLEDPIVVALMSRDGITEHDLRRLIARSRRKAPARFAPGSLPVPVSTSSY